MQESWDRARDDAPHTHTLDELAFSHFGKPLLSLWFEGGQVSTARKVGVQQRGEEAAADAEQWKSCTRKKKKAHAMNFRIALFIFTLISMGNQTL